MRLEIRGDESCEYGYFQEEHPRLCRAHVAYKHADPTEGARYIEDDGEARRIEGEDPALIVWLDGRGKN